MLDVWWQGYPAARRPHLTAGATSRPIIHWYLLLRPADWGDHPDVYEPSLQHSAANCTGPPKNDPKDKDERGFQGFFHCLTQKVGQMYPPVRSGLLAPSAYDDRAV